MAEKTEKTEDLGRSIKKIWEICAPFRRAFLVSFALLFLIQAFGLVLPYVVGEVINRLSAGDQPGQIIWLAYGVLAVGLAQSFIGYIRNVHEINKVDFRLNAHVTVKTLRHLLKLSIGQHRNQNTGLTQSVIGSGESGMVSLLNLILFQFLPVLIQMVVAGAAIFWLGWPFGLVIVTGVALFAVFVLYANKYYQPKLKQFKDMGHDNSKFRSELLRNLPLVQVNAKENDTTDRYLSQVEGSHDFGRQVWTRFMSWALGRDIFTDLIQFGVLVLGIYLLSDRPGHLVTLMMWTNIAVGNLTQFASLHRQMLDQWLNVNKYFGILDLEPAVKLSQHPIRPASIKGRIEFRDVSFTYPTGNYFSDKDGGINNGSNGSVKKAPVASLNQISFTIEPGQRVAFVGASGAGKSTIINLILRAYDPSAGEILIDGQDLRELDLAYYRRQIGFVEQQVSLFDDTLGHNILFGLERDLVEKNGSDLLDSVSRDARIDSFYPRLTEGFDTKIGERGIKLSGGEGQRVGIARALVKKPAILILDEATSNLDAINEALIKESVEEAAKGRTTILIAHRLSTVIDADKIFVLDHGRLIDQGKHQELLQNCPVYEELVRTQLLS